MTKQTSNTVSKWASWPLDREIVIARVVDADRETAFQAWADPAQIVQWFGPDGFRIETHEADIRAGGVWRFDMVPAKTRSNPAPKAESAGGGQYLWVDVGLRSACQAGQCGRHNIQDSGRSGPIGSMPV